MSICLAALEGSPVPLTLQVLRQVGQWVIAMGLLDGVTEAFIAFVAAIAGLLAMITILGRITGPG